jgi:hypothetical protein
MKKNIFFTIMIILLITGGISYLIIWWRNKKNADGGSAKEQDVTTGSQTNGTVINTGPLKPVNTEAIFNGSTASGGVSTSKATWIKKIGHASFPLGNGSKGVEVVYVQEFLNRKATEKTSWGLSPIAVDGIWGNETDTRFKLFYPGFNLVTQYMFITEFNGEILK